MGIRTWTRRITASAILLVALASAASAGKITVDPNAGAAPEPKSPAAKDPRLAQKITYEARHRAVHLILQDLSDMTNVKFIAGASRNDWPVRDRKMNIFVKDTKLADLMNSIARVMKFRWACNYDLDPPVYRFIVDKKEALAADAKMAEAEKKREEVWRKRRLEWVDAIVTYGTKPIAELEPFRQSNPVVYRYARYGVTEALRALFLEVPEARKRFEEGRGFRIASDKVSTRTRDLFWSTGNEYWKYLQLTGYIGCDDPEPSGYGDMLKVDDSYDLAFVRMDTADTFTPGLRWGGTTQLSSGYFHIMMHDGRDREVADLRAISEDWSRFLSEEDDRTLDHDTSPRENGQDRYARLMADQKKEYEELYPSEPLVEHSDFPELATSVKLKVEELPKSDMDRDTALMRRVGLYQKSLAEATGLGVVSDSWVGLDAEKEPVTEGKLSDLLESFSKELDYNWDNHAGILELRHRRWWRNRLNQIPDAWVDRWSENTRKAGMLSLDDLAQISTLNYDQAQESVRPDMVIGRRGVYRNTLNVLDRNGNLSWLRLYASLNPSLRALLTERNGVNGFMLTQSQWKLAQTMFDRIGASRGDALFRLEIVTAPGSTVCRFKEIDTDTNEVDRVWEAVLPRYTPPAEKQEKK